MPTSLQNLYRPATGGASLEEPLPSFGVMNAYNAGSGYFYTIVDSYWTPVISALTWSSENFSNYNSYTSTSGYVSSGSLSTAWGGATPFNQAEGNWVWNPPSNAAEQTSNIRNTTGFLATYWPYLGITIGKSGKRQQNSFYFSSTNLQLLRKGTVPSASITVSGASMINATGEPGANANGTICYNERTNTLAIIRGSSSSYRLHVWKNPNIKLNESSTTALDVYNFIIQAKAGTNGASYFYNDFTWSTSSNTSYNESMYHFRVIMGDNGKVGMVRFTPNTQTIHASITPNPAGTSVSAGPTTVSSVGVTTSYGIDNGSYYGMRSNITWDNSFVAAYSPYYYYGSGLNIHFVSTEDPSWGQYWQYAGSSHGVAVFPMGASEFGLHLNEQNADSNNGMQIYIAAPLGGYKKGRDATGSTVTNGSYISMDSRYLSVDTGYTSTNYPHLIALNTWPEVDR